MIELRSLLRRALTVCALMLAAAEACAQTPPSGPSLNFLPGHYLIRQKPGVTAQQLLRDLQSRANGQVELVETLADQGLVHVRVTSAPPSRAISAATMAEAQHERGASLASSDNVVRIEPVVQYRLAQTRTEPEQASQALREVLERLQAPGIWSSHRSSGKPVVVAVIDTGVLLDHEMFKGIILSGYDVTRGVANASPQRMPSGAIEDHGTRVAGMVAAMLRADPAGGPGPLPNIRILPVRATRLSDDGTQQVVLTPDGIKAIDYAVARGARVINLSWGENVPSEELRDALRRANEKGVVVVAAAGNGRGAVVRTGFDIDAEPFYPASYKLANIIGVAAVNDDDVLAPWSNWGRTAVEIAAPGERVLTPIPYFDTARNRLGSGYSFSSGTSFAAPLVAGAAALLISAFPNLSQQEIVALMTRGVDRFPALAERVGSGGRLNLAQLFSSASPAVAAAPPVQMTPQAAPQAPETPSGDAKITVDIRAYANDTAAVDQEAPSPVLRGRDVAPAPPPAGAENRIDVLIRFDSGRRPRDVLKGLADARAITIKRASLFRNSYTVTIETAEDKTALIARLKQLPGVRNAEPVGAYKLQDKY